MKPLSMFIKRIFLLLLFLGLPGAFAETTTPDDSGIIGEITGWIDGNTCTFLSEPPENGIYRVRLWLVDAPKESQSNYLDFMGYIQKNTFYSSGEKRVELKIIANEPGGAEKNVVGILTKLGHPSSCQQEFWESGYCGFNEGDVKMNEGETEEFREIYDGITKKPEPPKKTEEPVIKAEKVDDGIFVHLIAKGDSPDRIGGLLDSGAASANAKGYNGDTALIAAVKRGDLKIVKLLVEHGAEDKNTALIAAVKRGDLKIVELLVEHDADPDVKYNGRALLYWAKNWRDPMKTRVYSKNKDPITEEELKKREELTELLIKHGAVDEREKWEEEWAKELDAQDAKNAGAPIPGFGTNTPRKDALKGTLIDFSHPKRGSGLTDPTTRSRTSEEKRRYGDGEYIKKQFADALEWLADHSSWAIGNIKSKHPVSPTTLYTTSIYIENKDKNVFEPTKEAAAYGTDKERNINHWLCFYEGEFGVPEEGDYRFVGQAYGAMLVGVDLLTGKKTETVLYAFDPKPENGYGSAVKSREGWESCGNLYKGTWLHLVPGKRYPVKIAFGTADSPGNFQVKLGIQKMDRDDDKNFPLFTLEKVKSYPKKKLDEINAEIKEIKSKLPSEFRKSRSNVTVSQEEQEEQEELTARKSWLEKQRGDLEKQRGDLKRSLALPDTGPYSMSDIFAVQEPPPKEKAATTKKSSGDGKKTRKHTTQSPKS